MAISKENVSEDKFQEYKQQIIQNKLKLVSILLLLVFLQWTYFRIHASELSINIVLVIFATLYLGTIYLCISLGLSITYKLIGFANFAHAEYFVTGAYIGVIWSFIFSARTPRDYDFYIVLVLAFIFAGFTAVIGDLLVFEPLRKMSSSPESMMISSIGWGIIIRNVISIFVGGDANYYRSSDLGSIYLPSIRLGGKNGKGLLKIEEADYSLIYEYVNSIIISIVLVTLLFIFLEKTKTGKALRATSDNMDLAESSGIDTTKMIRLTWFIGGGLAGIAGILFATTLPIIPFTGFLFLLPAFAVVVLGGIGSLKGSAYAAFIIAAAQTIGISFLSGFEEYLDNELHITRERLTSYAPVIPFAILIVVILIRPTGLFGEETMGEN